MDVSAPAWITIEIPPRHFPVTKYGSVVKLLFVPKRTHRKESTCGERTSASLEKKGNHRKCIIDHKSSSQVDENCFLLAVEYFKLAMELFYYYGWIHGNTLHVVLKITFGPCWFYRLSIPLIDTAVWISFRHDDDSLECLHQIFSYTYWFTDLSHNQVRMKRFEQYAWWSRSVRSSLRTLEEQLKYFRWKVH